MEETTPEIPYRKRTESENPMYYHLKTEKQYKFIEEEMLYMLIKLIEKNKMDNLYFYL